MMASLQSHTLNMSDEPRQDLLALVRIIILPGSQSKGLHEMGPSTVRLDDSSLVRGKGRFYLVREGLLARNLEWV